MKKLLKPCLALLGVAVIVSVCYAAPLAVARVARLVISRAGADYFSALVNSSNQLVISNINGINGAVANFDDADGSLLLRTRTSAQIGLLAPTRAGALIVNSDENKLCISTGTAAGAWVHMSTSTQQSVRGPCY